MKFKDWRHLGEVTVKAANGSTRRLEDLEAAVRFLGRRNVESLGDHPILGGWLGVHEYTRRYVGADFGRFVRSVGHAPHHSPFESFVVIDELGMRVPAWRVHLEYDNLPNVALRVDSRRYSHRWRHRSARHPRVFSTAKAWVASKESWEVLTELGVRTSYRRPEAARIDPWDDHNEPSYHHRSWKDYRRTQHRAR